MLPRDVRQNPFTPRETEKGSSLGIPGETNSGTEGRQKERRETSERRQSSVRLRSFIFFNVIFFFCVSPLKLKTLRSHID